MPALTGYETQNLGGAENLQKIAYMGYTSMLRVRGQGAIDRCVAHMQPDVLQLGSNNIEYRAQVGKPQNPYKGANMNETVFPTSPTVSPSVTGNIAMTRFLFAVETASTGDAYMQSLVTAFYEGRIHDRQLESCLRTMAEDRFRMYMNPHGSLGRVASVDGGGQIITLTNDTSFDQFVNLAGASYTLDGTTQESGRRIDVRAATPTGASRNTNGYYVRAVNTQTKQITLNTNVGIQANDWIFTWGMLSSTAAGATNYAPRSLSDLTDLAGYPAINGISGVTNPDFAPFEETAFGAPDPVRLARAIRAFKLHTGDDSLTFRGIMHEDTGISFRQASFQTTQIVRTSDMDRVPNFGLPALGGLQTGGSTIEGFEDSFCPPGVVFLLGDIRAPGETNYVPMPSATDDMPPYALLTLSPPGYGELRLEPIYDGGPTTYRVEKELKNRTEGQIITQTTSIGRKFLGKISGVTVTIS